MGILALWFLVLVLDGCSTIAEHANEYFATPVSVSVKVPSMPPATELRAGVWTVHTTGRWQRAQIHAKSIVATFYHFGRNVYALERVKVSVDGKDSYTPFLVAASMRYVKMFAEHEHTATKAADATPRYPTPIYSGTLPAPTVTHVLPGAVTLKTWQLQFTIKRNGYVDVFGDGHGAALVFLYDAGCNPCDEDLDAIAHDARAIRATGAHIYMIVPNRAARSARNALTATNALNDIQIVVDRHGGLFSYLGTNTMPRNYIFAREGRVAVARMGSFPPGELRRNFASAGVPIHS